MKKLVIVALAATTALSGVMSSGVAAAQPRAYDQGGYDQRHDGDRHDGDRRDGDRDRRDHDDRRGGHRSDDGDRNGWYRQDRWEHGHRFYGGRHGYNGYRGSWRTGQRYPHYRDNRYVISDYRAYRLPPPRPGYRYYRDDRGDIVMVAIASGLIGAIIGSTLNH